MKKWLRLAKPVVTVPAFQARRLTSANRALPNFIIIGTQKGGTTSLYRYLAQHPDLIASFTKEVHYFDGGLNPAVDTYALGLPWYRAHFPAQSRCEPPKQCFEASPLYMFNPLVPERIKQVLPAVKLIAILRDPVERAISHYFHEHRKGREPLPIEAALAKEADRLAPIYAQSDYKQRAFIDFSYQARGRYHEQLQRFDGLFPRENMLVLTSESLFTDPHATLGRVLEFVGADTGFSVPNLKPRNVGSNRTDVAPAVYESLRETFRPHNQALYEWAGEDFGWS